MLYQKELKLAIISHFGRPTEGEFNKKFSLRVVARRLVRNFRNEVFFEDTPLDINHQNIKKI